MTHIASVQQLHRPHGLPLTKAAAADLSTTEPPPRMQLHERPVSLLRCRGPRASHRLHSTHRGRGSCPKTSYVPCTTSQPTRSPVSTAATTAAQIEQEKQAHGDILQQMLNYRYQVDMPDGHLVIAVMREEWLPRCADLLADTFVDTKGIQAYRRYVRRNIHTYLEQHHKMPPSAVLLTAVLHTTVTVSRDTDALMLEGSLPELQSSNSSSNGTVNSSNPAAASSSHMDNSNSVNSSSSSTSDSSANSPASSSSSSSDKLRGVVGAVVQHFVSGLGLQQQQQQVETRTVQHLVGIAEVSFREFTRSSYLTLNPPKKCAYLCNMAVSADWRRRGIASYLITAAEDFCILAGEQDVYLHLRCKDADVAGGLYSKAGFVSCKKDWPVVLLLGLEPRFLMKKQLHASKQLVGKVLLPQLSGEEQQQQQTAKVAQPAAAASPAA